MNLMDKVAPCTLDPAPCTLDPAPWTLHSGPCTLDPAPCTLHPALWTLHPAPCTQSSVHRPGAAWRPALDDLRDGTSLSSTCTVHTDFRDL